MVSSEHLQKWGAKGKKNLEHELSILSKIKHRNIVRLEEFVQTANNYYLIFEYCAGGDLREYLRSAGAMNEFAAQRFLYQLA
jgi:serine/threonine-protein kinase ULK/ATG1